MDIVKWLLMIVLILAVTSTGATAEDTSVGKARQSAKIAQNTTKNAEDNSVKKVTGKQLHEGLPVKLAAGKERVLRVDLVKAPAKWIDCKDAGAVTLRQGKMDVLSYRYGDQCKKGLDSKYTHSCYIHPLNGLDGEVLTDDFPADHRHHRGLYWTWPQMKVRGREVQTWHPSGLRQQFVKWIKKEIQGDVAILHVENEWKLDGKEKVATEKVKLTVHPADAAGRAIDVDLTFEAIGGPIELLGAKGKGYGGFSFRGAPMFKGAPITTDTGRLKKDSLKVPFRWADISTQKAGVAVFVSPDHPNYPPTWMLRNSYGGILNVSWPGLKPFVLQPGKPMTLRYRLYVHQGGVNAQAVKKAYAKYLAEQKGRR